MTKNSIRDRYKPISKNTKTLDPLLYYIKGKQLWSSESWIFDGKKKKNIKIQLPAISMHVRLPQSLISMSIQKLHVYTNWSSFAQSARFSRPGALLQLSPTLSRKDSSVLTSRYWFPILFSLSVVLKYKVPVYCYFKKFRKIKYVGWRPSYSTKSS